LVAALTGTPGDLTDLTAWVDDIPLVGDFVNALTGSTGGLLDLSTWAGGLTPLASFDDLLSVLSGSGSGFGGILGTIESVLGGFLTGSSPLPGGNIVAGTVPDTAVPGIGSILDSIFGAITGVGGAGRSHTEATDAMAAQSATVTGSAAAVARLETAFTSGISTGDDFERGAGGLGAGWSVTYSSGPGTIGLDGHNAVWNAAALTASTRTATCRWLGTNPVSFTDYQRVTVVLNTVPEVFLIGAPAANDILLRMDSGATNFIRIRFAGDKTVSIRRIVSGVETTMNSGTLTNSLSAGASLTGEAGKLGTARYFRALVNGFPVLEWTEASAVSMVGSSYRGWGFGMFAGSKTDLIFVPAQAKPGQVKQWTAADQ
jgi:hypothetical protein